MMLRSGLAAVLVACAAVMGCREPTKPHPALVVSVSSPAVVATRSAPASVMWGQFRVEVTLRNPTASTIRVYSCGPAAERESAAGWQRALEPICSLAGPGYLELPPGSERMETAQIAGALSGNGGPEFLGGVLAGRYRLLYRYGAVGQVGLLDEARSTPFDVTE